MRTAPTALVLAGAALLAWRTHGSLNAVDWLPYSIVAALVVAVVLAAGAAVAPRRAAITALALLAGLALWAGLSSQWAALPSLARDEGLLTISYAVVAAIPLLTLSTPRERIAALGCATAALGGVSLAVGLVLLAGPHPLSHYGDGRLGLPITYANGSAALFAAGFWPAILLAARRRGGVVGRALALGAAGACLGATLLPQSKGATLGLAVSVVLIAAISPARLRLLVPVGIVFAGAAAAFLPLTEPFRTRDAAAIREAGLAAVCLAAGAAVAGLVYALADRRIELRPSTRRIAGHAALGGLVAVLVAGAAAFLLLVGSPTAAARHAWASFKTDPVAEHDAAHLLTLGSHRYDFWRVAVDEFRRHPLAGDGARGFGPAYLIYGRSYETPARAHSLPLEVLSEQGIVGFALLAGALGTLLVLCARGARARRGPAAAALGAGIVWLVQACVDWTWTMPAATVPAIALLGVGAAGGGGAGVVRGRTAVAGSVAAVALAVLAFAPPWLSGTLSEGATASNPNAARDLRWARRLDPLSTAPLVAEAGIAGSPAAAVAPLEQAVAKDPRAVALRYYLGLVELQAGDGGAARAQLEAGLRLKPGDPLLENALARTR